jgi:CDP-glycerol glycerophosphotransferase (TagB/SpsB family)
MIKALARNILPIILRILTLFITKKKNLILFGAFAGDSFGDNSGALYKHFINKYKRQYHCVWLANYSETVAYARSFGGEAFLKTSLKGLWFSLRASLIITSHRTQDVLVYKPIFKRPKELYLHHGVPMRIPKFDKQNGGVMRDRSFFIDQAKSMTYMVSTSKWSAAQQGKLYSVKPSQYKIDGYPRNDIFFHPNNHEYNNYKKEYSVYEFIILYAPTWRKWVPVRFFPFPDFDLIKMVNFLREQKMCIFLNPHPTDMRRQKNNKFWDNIQDYQDVLKIGSINKIYSDVEIMMFLSNCLITDYSSIHYDYLLLDRPIIYLPYDKDEYVNKMGEFNCDYEEFTPGPKPRSQEEFIHYLESFKKNKDDFSKKRERIKEIVHKYQDGQSCQRVYKTLIEML